MIHLQATNAGVLVSIRARPGARKNAIEGEHDGMLKISVTAPPEKGKANKAIIALLSDLLDVPKSSIEIVSGTVTSRKRTLIRGKTPDQIRAVLSAH